jgi:bifunctional UDP-N-acetylglucosamine pyrophosphorylase/glucosamine-1-phosphate N-acetyltransferase
MCVVVLAAGEGTRMRSSRPKPLHHLCGRPMIQHVLDAAVRDEVKRTVVVVGHGATWVEKSILGRAGDGARITFVEQSEQLGTGHAVSVAVPALEEAIGTTDGEVLILPGDTPLLRASTVTELLDSHRDSGAALTVLTAIVEDPAGYGRVVYGRDDKVAKIVEERDATSDERLINEVNTSIMVVRESLLGPALRLVGRANSQNEYYLTDLVSVLYDAGHLTRTFLLNDPSEATGVNDRDQLAAAERTLRRRINQQWMRRGVTMWDPESTYIDSDVELHRDVSLLPGTVLKGRCQVGEGTQIGPNATLQDVIVGANATVGAVEAAACRIGDDAHVASFCVLEPGVAVAKATRVPPFSHLTL